jgi:hypothetical protein
LEHSQKELEAIRYGLETTAVESQDSLNKLESRDIALQRKVKEVLEFQTKSASTIHNLNAELQQVNLALASALLNPATEKETLIKLAVISSSRINPSKTPPTKHSGN